MATHSGDASPARPGGGGGQGHHQVLSGQEMQMWTRALTSSEAVTEMASAQGKGNPEEEAFLKTTISSFSVQRAEVPGWSGPGPSGRCTGPSCHPCFRGSQLPPPSRGRLPCVFRPFVCLSSPYKDTSHWIWGPPNPLWVQNDAILTNYTCRDLCLSIITSKVLGRCERFGRLCSICAEVCCEEQPPLSQPGGDFISHSTVHP